MRIGAYEKLRDLGVGGMGIVILARHLTTDRLYAIKFIKEKLIYHREGLQRFEREKRILQELSRHPYILPLVDSGIHEGIPYYVMPYVDGISLKEKIQVGQLTPIECEAIMHNIADALFYAHKRNILHRDIKPGNILIDRDGQAYLTDFGIAVDSTAGQEQLTLDLSQMGSIGYTAPEINLGKQATIRTEVYSLGAVLYEMLTGIKMLDAMTRTDNYWQALPPSIASVLQRATHTTINERFDNVRDFYYAFSGAVRGLYTETIITQQIPALETNDFGSKTPITLNQPKRGNSSIVLWIIIVLILVLTIPIYFILNQGISEEYLFGDDKRPTEQSVVISSEESFVTSTRNVTATRRASPTPLPTLTWTPTMTHPPSATPTNTIIPSPAATDVISILIINPQGTNLRSGPGTEFPISGVAINGRVYTVIARTNNLEPWFLVDHNGQRMWVLSSVVQLNGNREDIPIAATVPPSP